MRTYFKNLLMCVSIAFIFAFTGCQQNSVTPQKVQQIAAEVNSLSDQAAAYQQQAVKIAKVLADSNIIDPNILTKVNQLNAEADKVRAKIVVLTAALQSVKLTGDNNQDLLTLLQQLNAASASFNPYAAPTAGVLGLISLILTAIAKKKNDENKSLKTENVQTNKAVDELVTAGDIFADYLKTNPEAANAYMAAHNKILTQPTLQKVATIKEL